jgi:hypothetical protein
MKKSALSLVLAAAFCVAALTACQSTNQSGTTTAAAATTTAAATKETTTTAAETTTAAAQTTTAAKTMTEDEKVALEEDLIKMVPVLDSIARGMSENQEDVAYSVTDPDFFWSVLYLMGNNYGMGYQGVESVESGCMVPRQVMELFASAAFRDYKQLPAIPESVSVSISYDEAKDAYILMGSDMSDTVGKIDEYTVQDDGSIQLTLGMYSLSDEETQGAAPAYQVKYTLVANPNGHVDENMGLFYSVTQAEAIYLTD